MNRDHPLVTAIPSIVTAPNVQWGPGLWAHLDAAVLVRHDASMRTTLTLDPDVARMIREEVHRVRKPVKEVVNEALRRGLTGPASRRPRKAYRVQPHTARLLPGVDRGRLNALADELEDAAIMGKARGRRPS